MNQIDYSVVIPTLGGPELASTIQSLNESSIRPAEILICLPGDDLQCSSLPEYNNIRLVATGVKGQVQQRIAGFRLVKCEYVLQLDDDIHLDQNCVEQLLETLLQLPHMSAVAPVLFSKKTGSYGYPDLRSSPRWIFFYWILNGKDGFVSGRISKSGFHFHVTKSDLDAHGSDPFLMEWLPGGCVLHHRSNLCLENYFPWSGKAFAEDLFHSDRLQRKGIALFLCPLAKAYFDFADLGESYWEQLRVRFQAQVFLFRFARETSCSNIRLAIFYIMYEFGNILDGLFRIFSPFKRLLWFRI